MTMNKKIIEEYERNRKELEKWNERRVFAENQGIERFYKLRELWNTNKQITK